MAKKIAFDAYGQTPEMPDPVTQALDRILDHLHKVDDRLQALDHAPQSPAAASEPTSDQVSDSLAEAKKRSKGD